MATRGPKEKRRNSEKRKEKSRDAARYRRSKESDIFADLTRSLPLCSSSTAQLDKASVMRLTIAYLKSRTLLETCEGGLVDENQAPYDFALPNAMDGFLLALSSEGDVVYVTETVNQHLGFPQIDIMGQSIYDYSHPCDHDELREILSLRADSSDDSRSFFLRLKSTLTTKGRSVNMKSASYKVINCSGRIVRLPGIGGNAAPFFAVLICEPIPHPSNIEVPLDGYTFLTKHSMDMKYTYVDDKITEFLGFSVDEMEGKSAYEFHHILDHDAVIKSYKILLTKGQCQTPVYRFLARHGGFIWVQTQATLVYGSRDSRPQAVVCVHHVLSGIEDEDEIFSVSQERNPVCESVKLAPVNSIAIETATANSRHPTAMTSKLIVPRTSEMDTNTFLSYDASSGTTVFKEEPEDLTHLAPAAGDTCIPLEISTDFFSMNELLQDEDFPSDILECFPMTTFDFMNLNPENCEDVDGLQACASPEDEKDDAISKTASVFQHQPRVFTLRNEEWDTAALSPPSLESADGRINLDSPIYSEESPNGPSGQRSSTPVSPFVSAAEKATTVLSNTTFRVTELAISEEEEEDYETRAPFIPNEEGHDLPIFDCADLFSEDLDCFLPRPFANVETTKQLTPMPSSLASLLQDNSLRLKTLPPNIGSCPFLDESDKIVEVDYRDQGVKRQTPFTVMNTPDGKRFKGVTSTRLACEEELDCNKKLTRHFPINRLLDIEDSMFNPVPPPVNVAQGTATIKIPNFFKCPPDRTIQQKQKQQEPETLRKLLTQTDPNYTARSNINGNSVLQNLLVGDSGPSGGKLLRLPQQNTSRDYDSEFVSIHSAENAYDLDTSVDSTNLPILLSPEPDFFDQLPICFGIVD